MWTYKRLAVAMLLILMTVLVAYKMLIRVSVCQDDISCISAVETGEKEGQKEVSLFCLQNGGSSALDYVKQRANAGDVDAKRILAHGYMLGVGGTKNEEKAFAIYSNLAANGDSDSLMKVGLFHQYGMGDLPVNYREAYSAYIGALDEFGGKAALAISGLYQTGSMDFPSDTAQQEKWAVKAEEMLVSDGSVEAFYTLGLAYSSGKNLKADDSKSFLYFHKIAEIGHVGGMIAVARAYYDGRGVSVDKEKARSWLDKAYAIRGDNVLDIFVRKYPQGKKEGVRDWYRKSQEKGSKREKE